jgi:hypothetical protein
MANEFGEEPSIYVWPTDHEDGDPFPDGFQSNLDAALKSAGISWEWA